MTSPYCTHKMLKKKVTRHTMRVLEKKINVEPCKKVTSSCNHFNSKINNHFHTVSISGSAPSTYTDSNPQRNFQISKTRSNRIHNKTKCVSYPPLDVKI